MDPSRANRDDRCIRRSWFEHIQNRVGRTFTLDACANASGDNALCSRYCSPENSFLTRDLNGEHVWLNPPFSNMRAFLDHYVAEKRRHPHTVSGCLLVPDWRQARHPALKGMQVVAQFEKGRPLFTAPCADGSRRPLGGVPWGVKVYYDPPVPSVYSALQSDENRLRMGLAGKVAGTPARCLIDTGASGEHYLSAAFCKRVGIAIQPAPQPETKRARHRREAAGLPPPETAPLPTVTLADGQQVAAEGYATVSVQIQSYRETLHCVVLPMTEEFDCVLGDAWLHRKQAVLSYQDDTCSLQDGPRRIVLHTPAPAPTPSSPSKERVHLLSHMQLKRGLRKGLQMCLALVRKLDHTPSRLEVEDPEVDAEPPVEPPHEVIEERTSEAQVDPQKLRELLDRYSDLFPESLPGFPPDRGAPATIPLIPGAKPSNRPSFRYSPAELAEMRAQIEYLLDRKLIDWSSSPYAAPVLFVKKPNGTFRMCVDYRALNRMTQRNQYPLPRIDDLLDQLRGARVFSAVDLMQGYYQIPLAEADRHKTAFRTPMGLFEFRVLPFGLTNAPAHFQTVMNRIFAPYIGRFVLVYLDDVLIFSQNAQDHLQHVEKVLQVLRENKFYGRLHKCHFNQCSIKYLGHIVSANGVAVNPEKIKAIQTWPTPRNLKEVRQFLGLANYFRKFICGYAGMAIPLTNLTRSDVKWQWSDTREGAAFRKIQQALTMAPVLQMPDVSKPFEVVTDASQDPGACGAVLLQDGHPIAFESRKFSPAEMRYTVTELELLAVVHALRVWRCYLEGSQFTVVTDHNPITFLGTQQGLSRRQARWSEFLQQFAFQWEYRPGRINVADPVSRIPEHSVANPGSEASGSAHPGPEVRDGTQTMLALGRPSAHPGALPASAERLRAAYQSDNELQKLLKKGSLVERSGLLYHPSPRGEQLAVPGHAMRRAIMKEAHDSPIAGHFGFAKTVDLVGRSYWWPGMNAQIRHYVQVCDVCQRDKARIGKIPGELNPLPIPDERWNSVSMDFIVELPCTKKGHDAIWVVVDRFSKMLHISPTTSKVTAADTAQLFFERVFAAHGLPKEVISDRGPQFSGHFWRELCARFSVKPALSTAFHPQTDGQTERMNRVIEDTLRHFVGPRQDAWDELLPYVEFAINNSKSAATGHTPFFLNYGRHPVTPLTWHLPALQAEAPSHRAAVAALRAEDRLPQVLQFTARLEEALQRARKSLAAAQDRAKQWADSRRSTLNFSPGDLVLLATKNLRLKCAGSRKLLPKWLGPFSISRVVSPVAYRLDLPQSMRAIHPVFHVSLLRPYKHDGTVQPPPPPVAIEDEFEYEVEAILDKRFRQFRRRKTPEYLIKWHGYGHEHNSWEPLANLENCGDLLQEFELRLKQQPATGTSIGTRRRRQAAARSRLAPR